MKTMLIVLFVFISYSLIFAQSEEEKLGEGITLTEKTSIADILSDPESFLDQVVLVEGEVVDVCPKMGCWMELKSDSEEKIIKVKVKDGDIVFPMEAIGKTAVVEGKVYKIELTEEDAVGYMEHLAEEKGQEFDPSTVKGPMIIYQIKGIGAEIYSKEG
jgi:co-chaperonin GroES (HSP10)